ncbi:MAG TPA: hypothetical protein VE544_06095 [Nitrososphaeraceae archaeon]|jgi:hypothetical protein|nr:hypothetical protein [Nitrososphaeraceae archaeon]
MEIEKQMTMMEFPLEETIIMNSKYLTNIVKDKALEILREPRKDKVWLEGDPIGVVNTAIYVARLITSNQRSIHRREDIM